jgi:trimeric autotransporter adhesin
VPAPGPGVTSGDTYGITSSGRLVTFDRADASLDTAIAISGLQSGESVLGIDVRAGGSTPGQLYALGSTGRLYAIDTTTGVATLRATLAADASDTTDPFTALAGTEFGVDFNPVTDRLRVVSDTGQNLRIDADSGAVITDTPLGGATARAGVSGAAYTNAFAAACRSTLYYVDAATDQLLTTADPNGGAVSVVGALGVDATAVSDLEIATAADGTNTANAVLVVGGTPTLYSINLSTGAATSVAAVALLDSGESVRDTANAPPSTAPTQAPGDVYALTESGRLVSFTAAAPQKACTNVALSGQQSGEAIVGIDVRPSNQTLYALGNMNRLYTVDVASGALTPSLSLVAALGDLTMPYAGLVGTQFGVDFNPVNDLLRVTSDTGQNFRISNEGAVTTDVALNGAGTGAMEAAYSNNFVGAAVISTYFTIDAASNSLQRLTGNAIDGVLQNVGSLGVGDVEAVGGFDIYGPNNQGLAALTIGGSTTSDLFTVNLNTGAATRINTIAGGERVRGLAFARTSSATVLALTSDNRLVSFKPTTPATLDSDVAISGLQGSEAIVGMDIRPADGQLYALTDAGRVYTIDAASGTASGAITLSANPLDVTAPFSGLTGTRFGFDFSAVDGMAYVQSDTGQALRIDLAAGTVITDANLNPGTPQVVGTAYSNSYAGAMVSLQYELDLAGARLVRLNTIGGTLTPVGPFGVMTTFGLEGAFDIAGGENGLPVAALVPTGASGSTLYRVNLATGALSSMGAIGGGSTVVRAMAVRLN